MKSIPIGSLVRDTEQGDIGIVVGTLVEAPSRSLASVRTQLVLWPSNDGEARPMDLSVIGSGWVEVVST